MKIPTLVLFLFALVFTSCDRVEKAADADSPTTEATQPKVEEPATQPAASTEAETATGTEVVNVSPEEAQKLLAENDSVVVLDVRTPEEFAAGHIEGATNLDFKNDQFAEGAAKLDPEVPYLLHCRSGSRSGQALPILKGVSLKKIYHLDSGFNGWQEAGLPVAK